MANNIYVHQTSVTKEARRIKNKHHSVVVYLTGLSGSGKSTIANAAAQALFEKGLQSFVLDGDNVRFGLNKDLGFSDKDREENIRRIGEVAKILVESGQIVFTAFISPFQKDRDNVKSLLEADEFIEVFVDCPLDVCEERDPKGLYKKARSGEIAEFTGVSSPYEQPFAPDVILNTQYLNVEQCVKRLITYLEENQLI